MRTHAELRYGSSWAIMIVAFDGRIITLRVRKEVLVHTRDSIFGCQMSQPSDLCQRNSNIKPQDQRK